jgi:hypothetical protein
MTANALIEVPIRTDMSSHGELNVADEDLERGLRRVQDLSGFWWVLCGD